MTNEEMFENNVKLAYKIVNQYKPTTEYDMEDLKQIALMGLWKAVLNYNGKYAFSTFAYKVINCELKYQLLSLNKHLNRPIIKLQEQVSDDNSIKYEEVIPEISNNIEQLEDKLELEYIHKIETEELSKLDETKRQAYEYLKQGMTQTQVAKLLNISQPQVSRIHKKVANLIKKRVR